MANLITGIDWIDHGAVPRRRPSETMGPEDRDEGPAEERQDDERVPLDKRLWGLKDSKKRMKPFWWWAEERPS